jgi:flagellar hook-basal body complex protein FliE
MSIEAIAAIGAAPFTFQASPVPAPPAGGETFAAVLDGINSLNEQMARNDQAIQAVALGETSDLHQVMMNLEKTRLTFELALQVRNKTLEAYQELMRMQV